MLAADTLTMLGAAGGATVNEYVAVPPPGAGLLTVSVAVPAADRSSLVRASVNPPALSP